ncbi:hypothetical protein BGZ65_003019 [Modicella reniformis]|uniref:Uncharacterized protein n=1 Tax=Modicella reniformis TaxID=1440133 RepID=A0A9P6LZ33_9FUNG|nr:hypothetical protein BGZ65_003016 [Modicella reniformis]KAF9956039.1 hypothetical protein BGZ65_003019 [Modicella reniformis]
MGSSVLEHGHTNDQRGSTRNAQHTYPRNSVESNIAEALRSETTLKLHDGGILKVSKGPEKAVQYWHKESGQYVGPSAEPSAEQRKQHSTPIGTPPVLLRIPTTDGSIFDNIQIDTSNKATPSIKSRAESRPESPTESHHNTNVTATTGKMHEILNRMFSDQADDSDNISEGGESCSTFSGRVSATILALHQKREQEELEDAQSLYRPDTLEPVLEHLDSEAELKRKGSAGAKESDVYIWPSSTRDFGTDFFWTYNKVGLSIGYISFVTLQERVFRSTSGLADSSTQNISVPSEIDTDKETDLTGNPAALDPLGEDSATPSNESFRR